MPTWIIALVIVAIVVLLVTGGLALSARRDSGADIGPEGPAIDEDDLLDQLDGLDVDLVREQTPPPDMLVPLLGADEILLDATRAKIDERKALVVILDDRLVSVEATLGRMGAHARVIPVTTVESVSQRTNIGGEITIEADGSTHAFSHIPLRKFERFVATLRDVTSSDEAAGSS